MRHDRIAQAHEPENQERASYVFSRAGWGPERKRYLYLYTVYPPTDRPYLPSDEALRTMVAKLPGIRFLRSDRFSDHDVFYVYGRKRSLFATRGDPDLRLLRERFLFSVGASAYTERDIRPDIREAIQEFLAYTGFLNITWTGSHLIAYDAQRCRHDSRRMPATDPNARLFRKLLRICKGELPFFYGTALV